MKFNRIISQINELRDKVRLVITHTQALKPAVK